MEMLTTLNSSYDSKNWRNVYVDFVSLSKVIKFCQVLHGNYYILRKLFCWEFEMSNWEITNNDK